MVPCEPGAGRQFGRGGRPFADPGRGPVVGVADLAPVYSRVTWGAAVAGSAQAFALYFLPKPLVRAVGLSGSNNFEGRNIGTSAAAFAIDATALCLFAGGGMAAHLAIRGNDREAGTYGLMAWAVVFAMLLCG